MRLGKLDFCEMTHEHFELLYQWLTTPHVMKYWEDALSIEAVKSKYSRKILSANVRAIKCYQRAGFTERGLIETPDGIALLMEKHHGN